MTLRLLQAVVCYLTGPETAYPHLAGPIVDKLAKEHSWATT